MFLSENEIANMMTYASKNDERWKFNLTSTYCFKNYYNRLRIVLYKVQGFATHTYYSILKFNFLHIQSSHSSCSPFIFECRVNKLDVDILESLNKIDPRLEESLNNNAGDLAEWQLFCKGRELEKRKERGCNNEDEAWIIEEDRSPLSVICNTFKNLFELGKSHWKLSTVCFEFTNFLLTLQLYWWW